jgi:hypothetical protein
LKLNQIVLWLEHQGQLRTRQKNIVPANQLLLGQLPQIAEHRSSGDAYELFVVERILFDPCVLIFVHHPSPVTLRHTRRHASSSASAALSGAANPERSHADLRRHRPDQAPGEGRIEGAARERLLLLGDPGTNRGGHHLSAISAKLGVETRIGAAHAASQPGMDAP